MQPHIQEVFIGKPIPGGKQGSVLFIGDGGTLRENNSNFFWDDVAIRLKIGDGVSTTPIISGMKELISASINSSTPVAGTIKNTGTASFSGWFSVEDTTTVVCAVGTMGSTWVTDGVTSARDGFMGLGPTSGITAPGAFNLIIHNRFTSGPIVFNTAGSVRGRWLSGGGLIVGTGTAMVGTELLRVQGAGRFEGDLVAITGSNNLTYSVTTGKLTLTTAAAPPPANQFEINAGANAKSGILVYDVDNTQIHFDLNWTSGGGWIARNASVAWIRKNAALLSFYGSTGNVVAAVATETQMGYFDLSNGIWNVTYSDATTNPRVILSQAGAGDSGLRWVRSAAPASYISGIDATDGKWKVSYAANISAVLGTNDYFTISSAGAIAFPTALTPNGVVVVGTGGSLTRLAPGTDGYALVSDSTSSTGFAWEEMTGGTVIVDTSSGAYITLDKHPKNPLARTLWAPHPKRVKLIDLGPRKMLMVTGPQDIARDSSPTFFSLTLSDDHLFRDRYSGDGLANDGDSTTVGTGWHRIYGNASGEYLDLGWYRYGSMIAFANSRGSSGTTAQLEFFGNYSNRGYGAICTIITDSSSYHAFQIRNGGDTDSGIFAYDSTGPLLTTETSSFIDIGVASSRYFRLSSTQIKLDSSMNLGWSSGAVSAAVNINLVPIGAGTLSLQNGASACEWRVYGDATSAKYLRFVADTGGEVIIDSSVAATRIFIGGQSTKMNPGTDRGCQLGDGSYRWESINLFTFAAVGSTPASAGAVRLTDGAAAMFRNNANSGDWTAFESTTINSVADILKLGTSSNGTVIVARSKAGAPTTSDFPAGTWGVWRDTSGGTTKVYYNNAGALQSVSLV